MFLHFHISTKGDRPHLISEPYFLQAGVVDLLFLKHGNEET